MSNSGFGGWRPSLRTIEPVLVFAAVITARVLVGVVAGWMPHPITFVGAAAGTLGASLVLYVGHDVYRHTTSPTVHFFGIFFSGVPDDRAADASHWLVLTVGAVAGGIYPTVFHGLLGLPGSDITTLLPGIFIGLLWGIVLATCGSITYLVTGVLTVSARNEVRVFLEFYVVFGVVFATVMALSNVLWYPLFGI